MGFNQAKQQVLKALKAGSYRHEQRSDSRKNLLQLGQITTKEAIDLIEATRGQQAECSRHDWDSSIEVWVFKPKDWYIKFYFTGGCWFISFHQ